MIMNKQQNVAGLRENRSERKLLHHRPTEEFETHLLKLNTFDECALKYNYFGHDSPVFFS
jgi:ethanolamine ammonia-lyase large subunit